MSEHTASQWESLTRQVPFLRIVHKVRDLEQRAVDDHIAQHPDGEQDPISGLPLFTLCSAVERCHWEHLRELMPHFSVVEWVYFVRTFPLRLGTTPQWKLVAAREIIESIASEHGSRSRVLHPKCLTHFCDITLSAAAIVLEAYSCAVSLVNCRWLKGNGLEDLVFRNRPEGRAGLDRLIPVHPGPELHKVFGRLIGDTNMFSGFGGATSYSDWTVRDARSVLVLIPTMGTPPVMDLPSRGLGNAPVLVPYLVRYMPSTCRLSWLWDCALDPTFDPEGSGITSETVDCALLLRFVAACAFTTTSGTKQLIELGGVYSDTATFVDTLRQEFDVLSADLVSTHLGPLLPSSADELVRRLRELPCGTDLPIPPRPLVTEDNHTWLDARAAARRLSYSVFRGESDGQTDQRSRLFERAVQGIVDATEWSPSRCRQYVRRTLKRQDGSNITDVDAIAEQGKVVIILSCKSFRRRMGIGELTYSNVKTQSDNIAQAAHEWLERIECIRQEMCTSTHNFCGRQVVGCVVLPEMLMCSDPVIVREVLPDLPLVVSASELELYLRYGSIAGRPSLLVGLERGDAVDKQAGEGVDE